MIEETNFITIIESAHYDCNKNLSTYPEKQKNDKIRYLIQ